MSKHIIASNYTLLYSLNPTNLDLHICNLVNNLIANEQTLMMIFPCEEHVGN